jgi:hypothetical protein
MLSVGVGGAARHVRFVGLHFVVFRGVRMLDPETHSRREGRGSVEYRHAGAA